MGAIADYVRAVRREYATGEATEHSYRPALKALLESLRSDISATNEPQHRTDCGAPDMSVARGKGAAAIPVGYVECKDIGARLDEVESSEQLERYRGNLDNLILTDYLEFRWYVDGEPRARRSVRLARVTSDGQIAAVRGGAEQVSGVLDDFVSRAPEPISKPRDLAVRLAKLTHMIRDIIVQTFASGKASDLLSDLHKAFKKTLLPDLPADEFADMFAQTLSYGLFAARCNHRGREAFQRIGAAREIPRTNPFLRELFEVITGTALDDEPFVGFVDDLTRVLAQAEIGAILADFGKRTRREDPVVHFYETFLAAYDPKVREMRGVYYTPAPVVSYIVRSVDHILKEQFGLKDGLADEARVSYTVRDANGEEESRKSPRVLILDPACGTGTFLYHVVDYIRQRFVESNNAGMWPGYVGEQLLPRLFGFELLMAPYAMAHLKLGMQLAAQDMTEAQRERWAYDFSGEERLGVYLTNTLEQAEQQAETLFGPLRIITEEANAAAEVKRDMPIMVVLGNPPYSGHSANKGEWIDGLLKGKLPDGTSVASYYEVDGQPLGERNPKWLQDDYVKFIRFGQWRIERSGAGVLAFITNHGYLDNPTFRGMRQQLMNAFTDIYILNLHGGSLKGETCPDGSRDDNVFDIRQGVAIGIFVRDPDREPPATVRYADLWGLRRHKYGVLFDAEVGSTQWEELAPQSPMHLLVPQDRALVEECAAWRLITEALPKNTMGITTGRDRFAVDFEAEGLTARLSGFLAPEKSDEAARSDYLRAGDKLDVGSVRETLRREDSLGQAIKSCLYRPFDVRQVLYHEAVLTRSRREVLRHMLEPNLGMVCIRRVRTGDVGGVLVSSLLTDKVVLSPADNAQVMPLYLYPEPGTTQEGRRPNLSKDFVDEFAGKLGMEFVSDGTGDLKKTFGPEDIFHYIYAVFHCPTYRERYAEFLRMDFPRVPLTSDRALFGDLCGLGGELVALHLMEAPELDNFITHYPTKGDDTVEKAHPKYFAPGEAPPGGEEPLEKGRVYINRSKRKKGPEPQYFEGVPPEVWEFQVGGYQVCEKWLKDRRGRKLSPEDLKHYQRIVVALKRTIELMAEIDGRIEEWPIG